MKNTLSDLHFRRPGMNDAQAVFDLMLRRDMHESGQPDSDIENLLHDWEQALY